jgi:glycerophosphoryl diester phosphodiesterase
MIARAHRRLRSPAALSLLLLLLAHAGCTLPILNSDPRHSGPRCPIDPIFDLPAPLLFAHRGGAREVAESTMRGFCHAKCVGADVLELDARLTKDGTFVVWHGPSLDNVRIEDQKNFGYQRDRRKICEYTWRELECSARVSDFNPACASGRCDVSGVKDEPGRRLMPLETFLRAFPCEPINVEIKDFVVGPSAIDRFVRILDAAPACPDTERRRTVLVAAADDLVLAEFRRRTGGTYPTNIPIAESIPHALLLPPLLSQPGRALQVPPVRPFAASWAVSMAHRAGSAVHVFITKFLWIDGLDEFEGQVQPRDIHDLLDRNVDGIMTDRPREVRPLIDDWRRERSCISPAQLAARVPPRLEQECRDRCVRDARERVRSAGGVDPDTTCPGKADGERP